MNGRFEYLVTLLGLAALWFLWNNLWKPLRVDIYRQRLFALRDSLFDLAMDGAVAFDDDAYRQLRSLVNGMIRFAHRATLPSLVTAVLAYQGSGADPLAKWNNCVATLPAPAQKSLREIHERMFELYLGHLFTGSVSLQLMVIFFLARKAVRRAMNATARGLDGSQIARAYRNARRDVAKRTRAVVIEQRVFAAAQRELSPKVAA